MEAATQKQLNLYLNILPKETLKAFEFLSTQKWLGQAGWYLAEGTALALQAENRKSVDLDFFTLEKSFNVKTLLANLIENKNWHATFEENSTLYGELFGAKISFIAYPFFIPKQEFISCGSIKILQSRDIAVMKIIAVSQRGRKRDFFDLYWCAQHIESLIDIIKRLPGQYPAIAYDYHHILKSLVYFDDAESDPDPEINFNTNWGIVKSFFQKEIPIIMDKLVLETA